MKVNETIPLDESELAEIAAVLTVLAEPNRLRILDELIKEFL